MAPIQGAAFASAVCAAAIREAESGPDPCQQGSGWSAASAGRIPRANRAEGFPASITGRWRTSHGRRGHEPVAIHVAGPRKGCGLASLASGRRHDRGLRPPSQISIETSEAGKDGSAELHGDSAEHARHLPAGAGPRLRPGRVVRSARLGDATPGDTSELRLREERHDHAADRRAALRLHCVSSASSRTRTRRKRASCWWKRRGC